MPEPPRSDQREQSQSRSNEREAERPAQRKSQSPREAPAQQKITFDTTADDVQFDAAQATSMKAGEAIATKGRAGESNLVIKWIDVWIGNAKPCRFDVATSPGHGLEVTVEQVAYKKTYTGTTAISTQPVPLAAPGTTFKVTARDTTTGEMLEQPGHWYDMSTGALFARLWKAIKRLLWKPQRE